MALFSFRRLDIDPLAVSMSGVKLGERLLQVGVDDAGDRRSARGENRPQRIGLARRQHGRRGREA